MNDRVLVDRDLLRPAIHVLGHHKLTLLVEPPRQVRRILLDRLPRTSPGPHRLHRIRLQVPLQDVLLGAHEQFQLLQDQPTGLLLRLQLQLLGLVIQLQPAFVELELQVFILLTVGMAHLVQPLQGVLLDLRPRLGCRLLDFTEPDFVLFRLPLALGRVSIFLPCRLRAMPLLQPLALGQLVFERPRHRALLTLAQIRLGIGIGQLGLVTLTPFGQMAILDLILSRHVQVGQTIGQPLPDGRPSHRVIIV